MKTFYTIVSIILISSLNLFSKDIKIKDLPLSISNTGQEFYFSFIPAWDGLNNEPDIKLFISSNIKTLVTVEVKSHSFKQTKFTIPNQIIEFSLPADIAQPYRKQEFEPPEPDNVWKQAGIHVYADAPIVCYGMSKNLYSSDGFLAIPVNMLGKNYIISSSQDPANNTTTWFPGYTAVTAAYDQTKVTFTMGGTAWSKTAGGLMPSATSAWNLNAGDVLLIASSGQYSDISGSTVSATKPVSVVSGSYCAYVPSNVGVGDYMIEMEIPTHLWGTLYQVPPIPSKTKNSYVRIFAKEAKTKIYRDGQQIGFLRTAGGVDGDGYLFMRADEGTARPITFGGDKPIAVTQYNTGQQDDNTTGDPLQVVIIPPEQYTNEFVFCTPNLNGNKAYNDYYINICYEATQFGTIPDDMEFAKLEDSVYNWQKLIDISPNPGQPFETTSQPLKYYSKSLSLTEEGVYKMKSGKPFQVYLYGFSQYDAFGFPAAADLLPLLPADTLPPVPEWVMDCNGNVNVINTKYVVDKPDDTLLRSNLATIFMDTQQSYNYKLYHSDFIPCESEITSWRLEIINPNEDAKAVVSFFDCAGNDTTLDIMFYAPDVSFSQHTLSFENCKTDTVYEKTIWLKNNSEFSKPKITTLELLNQSTEFSVTDTNNNPISLPFEIEYLDSLPFIVSFHTNETGKFFDTFIVLDTCADTISKLNLEASAEGIYVEKMNLVESISIAPIPASEKLSIKSELPVNDIKIFDILGLELLCTVSSSENKSEINVSNLPNGIYFLKISSGNNLFIRKFIIQK